VVGGLSKKQAIEEAARCPQCADPVCVEGCPLHIDIPVFIRSLREGNAAEALNKIREANVLTGICGRACSAPCETACILNEEKSPISIRALERYAWDHGHRRQPIKKSSAGQKIKIAVVGSGPAGLTAAVELVRLGYQVTVFESLHEAGGVLSYGIPEFRLPRKILGAELEYVRSLGVEVRTNTLLGPMMSIKEIFETGYQAILLALGAGVPKFSNIPGENLVGVYLADEFLMRVNLMKAVQYPNYGTPLCLGHKVTVIGRGHPAMDSARTLVRLGKEVTLVHQGTEEDIFLKAEELAQAREEGVQLEFLTRVTQIIPDEQEAVAGVKCLRLDFAETHSTAANGWQLLPVAGSEFTLESDSVIIAVGHRPNTQMAFWFKDLQMNKNGTIWTAKNSFMTSLCGVFVGGNLQAVGPLVNAMGQAQKAVKEIHDYVQTQVPKNVKRVK